MVSMAAHAAVAAVLLVALGTGHRHRPASEQGPPTRLVWVEPAPPALGTPGGAGPEPAPPAPPQRVVAPEPPTQPARIESSSKPPPKPPELARRGPARSMARPKPGVSTAPVTEAPAAAGSAAPAAGVPGGVAGGASGGSPGGIGDAALPVASVAAPPELVDRVVPEYPARARELEIEGQVVLEVVLDRRGRPEPEIKILKSVRLLDAAAVAAVRQWRFRPARDAEGRAVRVVMEVPVRFVLR